ncbi:LicD family protein [Weissella paramesenteroides]|uniref:LicD family protein n=1 Tax=Weissella paramesenteroides TaxID=1249 RepID=UPI002402D1A2|nr:LicD family protein [Weissella paramesenteroides]MDF8366779.1 LicD family protein [Weissella paramesenteroides]
MDITALKNALTNTSQLPALQKSQSTLLASLINFFRENNFTYFVTGGTVLGAKYYQGFIPYDDDIDMAMPREDFERFLSMVENKNFELKNFGNNYQVQHFSMDEKFKYTIARVENLSYDVIDIMDIHNTSAHPSIDIAPIDGTPNNRLVRKIFFSKLYILRGFLTVAYSNSINPIRRQTLSHKLQTVIAKICSHFLNLNPTKIKRQIEKTLSQYDMKTSNYSGTYMGSYRDKEMLPTYIWGEGSHGHFEDVNVVLPEYSDEYVDKLYGGFRYYTDDELLKDRHYIIKEKL